MKISTQYDRAIVEAAGIDASQYTDAEISSFAERMSRHTEVVSRANEIALRANAAQAITELVAAGQQARIHSTILNQCNHAPLKLK